MAPIATLTVRLSAQIAEFQKAFADTSKTVHKFADEFQGVATRAAAIGAFFGTIAADIARAFVQGLGRAFSQAIELSSKMANSLIGLSSVARAFGVDADAAKDAAERLSADGLMPLADSATGLKNLLAAGFNLEQSTRLMEAFKDSAAFGRQSALSFGEAVRSATEGVKNGNSILVDNAGVTKNLSQILKEAGFSAQDLSRASTDAGVRLALFNGILKETAAQTGDAERLTMTYAGQVSRLSTQYDVFLATLGAAITQNKTIAIAIGAVGDVFQALTTKLSNNRNGFNLVSDAVIFMAKAMSEAMNVIDMMQTAFAALQVAINRYFKAFAEVGIALFKFQERAAGVMKFLDPVHYTRHAAAVIEARDAYTFLEGAVQGFRDASTDAVTRSNTWGNTLQVTRGKLEALTKELEKSRGKTVELGTAAAPAGRAVESVGTAAASTKPKVESLDKAMKAFEATAEDTAAALMTVQASMDKVGLAVDRMMSGFVDLPIKDTTESVSDFWDSVHAMGEQAPDQFEKVEFSVGDLADSLGRLAQVSSGTFGAIVAEIAQFVQAMDTAKDAGEQMRKGGFTNIVQGGLAGATAIAQATSTGGTKSRTAKGAATGAQIGMAFGPWGALVGAGVGALVGYVRSLGQGRKAVEEFAKAHGGFDQLQARLSRLGDEGEQLWIALTQGVGRNNPQQAQETIAQVSARMAELEETQARFNTNLTDALMGIHEWGGSIPEALRPYLDQLREAGRLTEENMMLLDQLAGDGAVDWQQMQQTAEKYGIEIGALGQTFQNQRLHAQWQEIIDDADLLLRGGADLDAMLVGMADEISKVVQESQRFGTEIPENMRPWIEKLIASGQLLDVNGEKIEDIGSLTFGETLQTSLEKLTDEIQALIRALGGVPAAIDAIPKDVDVNVNYHHQNFRDAMDDRMSEYPSYDPPESFARGSQGWRNFGSGTPAMLHGVEAVVRPGEMLPGLREPAQVPINHTWNVSISAVDGADVERVMSQKIIPAFKEAARKDTQGLRHLLEVVTR